MCGEGGVYLVDTSVWIQVFDKRAPLPLEEHIPLDEVVTCLPVVQEVLQGFREETAFRIAREAMLAFAIVESPISLEVFESAVELYRSGRRSGLTIRSGIDCLIAVCALRHDLTVLHRDRDFDRLATISALKARNVAA
jgi:predicted nucleic acid-binding protein